MHAANLLADAELAFREGHAGHAERLLKRILAFDPSSTRANELMAYILGNRGDLEGALRRLKVATSRAGASREAWYCLGVGLQKKGQYRAAAEAIAKSLALGGEFFEGLHDLGLAQFHLGDASSFDTRLESIPALVPCLSADAHEAGIWRGSMELSGERMKIGIACSGNAAQRDDRRRSVALEKFAPLCKVADLFLVQKDLRSEDEHWLLSEGSAIRYLGDRLGDFRDSAAIVVNLDLVICVDTSLAHLAGALGKPVWVPLSSAADWRWLTEGPGTPWYPTARLFRQQPAGDWSRVFAEVAEALDAWRPRECG